MFQLRHLPRDVQGVNVSGRNRSARPLSPPHRHGGRRSGCGGQASGGRAGPPDRGLAETARKLAAQVTELVERPVVRPQALSVDATAESLSLSRSAVYHLLSTGQLVSAKVGTRRLIPLSAIDAFLATATSDEQAS